MSTTINWKAIDDKEKVRLILEHVIGCTFTNSIYVRHDYPGLYPICAYYPDKDDEAWYIRYEKDANKFDPLHDLNTAWLLIEKLKTSATLTYTRPFAPGYPEGRAAHYECEIVELDPICGNDRIARAIANSPAEAICIAALRWVGVQVTHTIEAIPCWQLTYEDGQKMIFRDRIQAERELASREQYLKDNLQWAKNVRKLKIEEMNVPEDYFNGPVIG